MLRVHNLRKFFRTYGRWSNPDCAECILGHSSGVSAVYSVQLDTAIPILEAEYLKCEANLSIFEQSKNIIELKEQVQKQTTETDMILKHLVLKNVEFETQLKTNQDTLDKYAKYQMEESVQQTGDLLRRINHLEVLVGHLTDELGGLLTIGSGRENTALQS